MHLTPNQILLMKSIFFLAIALFQLITAATTKSKKKLGEKCYNSNECISGRCDWYQEGSESEGETKCVIASGKEGQRCYQIHQICQAGFRCDLTTFKCKAIKEKEPRCNDHRACSTNESCARKRFWNPKKCHGIQYVGKGEKCDSKSIQCEPDLHCLPEEDSLMISGLLMVRSCVESSGFDGTDPNSIRINRKYQ